MRNLFAPKNKKGSLDLVLTGVFVLFTAGFLFVMGLIIMDETLIETVDTTTTVYNETLTTVTEAGETVTGASKCGFSSFTILSATNKSAPNGTINIANLTSSPREGKVKTTSSTSSGLNNTDMNVSYSYRWGNNSACKGANNTIYGQGKFGDYVDLIVLAIVIAVVISLILIGFAAKRIK